MALSFTLILAIAALLGLIVVFVATFAWKGMKVALISTAAALVIFAILYIATIFAIVTFSNM